MGGVAGGRAGGVAGGRGGGARIGDVNDDASGSPPRGGQDRGALDGYPVGDPDRGQVRWLLGAARSATGRLAASIAARAGNLTLGAALLAFPAWAVGALALDRAGVAALPVSPGAFVGVVLAAVLVVALVKAGLRYAEQLLGHLAAFRLMGELRVWMLDRLAPQAPAVTEGAGAGRVLTVAHRDIDRVEVFFAHTIAPVVTAALLPPVAVAVAWAAAGPAVAIVLALVLLAGLLVPLMGAGGAGGTARAVAATRAEIAQQIADTVRCREDVTAFGALPGRLDRLADVDRDLLGHQRAAGRRVGLRQATTTARVWGGTLAVLAAGLPALTTDPAGLPGLLLAASLVAGTAPALDSVERLARSLPAGLAATRSVRRLAAAAPLVADAAGPGQVAAPGAPRIDRDASASATHDPRPATDAGTGGGALGARGRDAARLDAPGPGTGSEALGAPVGGALDEVSFAYPGRGTAGVQDLDLAVAPGTVVGVCGATGSGKSTTMRLLQRRFDADAGAVRVGAAAPVDVRALPLAETWRRVVVADQRPVLVADTVAENVALGSPGATEDEIRAALRAACVADVVDALPGGLAHVIGQRGDTLSGGQRQRLALARALLRAGEDALLILDEATSHQDPLTQARLIGNLRGRRGGTLLVAHRLDTLREADEIVVLEAGRVAERGTWADLAAAGGAFARLLAADEGAPAR